MLSQADVFAVLHEALPRLPFGKAGDIGTSAESSRLKGKSE
jgi:hypothetical protein